MTIKTRAAATGSEEISEKPKRQTLSRARKPSAEQVTKAKEAGQSASLVTDAPEHEPSASGAQGVALEGLDRPVTGRGVFAVRTLGNAVSVESAFLEESGNVLRLPAVFPNREYAMQQIDELRQIVNAHFDDVEKATVN